MVVLKCPRCSHVWNYKGKNPYSCNCAYCRTGISIKRHTYEAERPGIAIIDYI